MDNTPAISKTVKLNIFQWNCRSLKPKLKCFEQVLIKEKVHIAVLSETWLEPDDFIKVCDYNIFRLDRDDSYGGVAILTHKSICAHRQSVTGVNSGMEVIGIKVTNCEHINNIYSIYCPSDVTTTQNDWEELLSIAGRKTLLLGDFNGHHVSWSNKTDNRGTQIYNSMLQSHFVLLNNGSITRLQLVDNELRESAPDLSFASSDICLSFDWSVTNETLGSDHLMIKLSTALHFDINIIKKRNFKKADWNRYTSYLETIFSNFDFTHNIQEDYDHFLSLINEAADAFIPIIKICTNPKSKFVPKSYWTPELSRAVAIRRIALKNFRRNPIPRNLELLNEKIRLAQRLLRKAQNESWHRFCSTLNEVCSATEMWYRMKWLKGYKLPKKSMPRLC